MRRNDEILKSIDFFIQKNGYSPSIQEIAEMNFISKTVAFKHVRQLCDRGLIQIQPKIARSIVIKTNVSFFIDNEKDKISVR